MRILFLATAVLMAVAFAGCSGSDNGEATSTEDDPMPVMSNCPTGGILDTQTSVISSIGTGTDSVSFDVPAGCDEVIAELDRTWSSWAGDVSLIVRSPAGIERAMLDGVGVGVAGALVNTGSFASGISMNATPGTWEIVSSGSGHYDLHVTVRLA